MGEAYLQWPVTWAKLSCGLVGQPFLDSQVRSCYTSGGLLSHLQCLFFFVLGVLIIKVTHSPSCISNKATLHHPCEEVPTPKVITMTCWGSISNIFQAHRTMRRIYTYLRFRGHGMPLYTYVQFCEHILLIAVYHRYLYVELPWSFTQMCRVPLAQHSTQTSYLLTPGDGLRFHF
jgi:hypothetical protein